MFEEKRLKFVKDRDGIEGAIKFARQGIAHTEMLF